MPAKQQPGSDSDLPRAIGQPATRALIGAGYNRLGHLARVKEADLLSLHGVGPKAIRILREALAERGLSFDGSDVISR